MVCSYVAGILPLLSEKEQTAFLDLRDRRRLEAGLSLAVRARDPAIVALSARGLTNGKAVAQASLAEFSGLFDDAYQSGLRQKLGLFTSQPDDAILAQDLLAAMTANQADFTLTFRALGDAALGPGGDTTVRALFTDPAAFDAWAVQWRARLALEPETSVHRHAAMQAVNPAFIPRNHRVEAVIQAAMAGDYAPFEELASVLAKPFEDQPERAEYADPPLLHQRVLRTFCGT